MRPIPAPRIGDSHGLLRAIDERERLRLDEFVTDFPPEDLYPPDLENALGRTRQFISFARAAGLCKEDRGVVELTEIGRRYVRAGDAEHPFDVSEGQAEWLRRQLREKHMTDSIFHGLAISISLLSSSPGARVATLDFGRALSYLGRAGWDNENTLQIQGERHLALLRDLELIDADRALTAAGNEMKAELTLPVHMSLVDLAAQLNPGGPAAVQQAGEAEWSGAAEPAPTPVVADEAPAAPPVAAEEDEYQDVGPGAWADHDTAAARSVPPPQPVAPATPAGAGEDAGGGQAAEPAVAGESVGAEPVPRSVAPPEPVSAPEPVSPPEPVAPREPVSPPEPVAPPEPVSPPPPPPPPDPVAGPVPPADVWVAAPDDATRAIPAVQPPAPADPRTDAPTVVAKPAFLAGSAIREAAVARGLTLEDAVFANIAAALSGRHVLLVGPPGSGKTELALAVAEAATTAGKASGATLIAGAPAPDEVLDAARTGRWLVLDDLAAAPAASAFLAHHTITIAGKEVQAPGSWRVVATAAEAKPLSRFAAIEVDRHPDLASAIASTAQDATAAAAVKRLAQLRDLQPLGAGLFLAAAAHAAARRAEQPADELTLAREAYVAYIQPHMGDKDAEAKKIVG